MPVRLLIIDDHPIVRAGLESIFELEDEYEVVASVESLARLGDVDTGCKPDLIICDLVLGSSRGTDLLTEPRLDSFQHVPVMIYSSSDSIDDVYESIEAGAAGFVIKSATTETLFYGIRTIMGGGTFVDPSLVGCIVEAKKESIRPNSFSERESQLLRLVADGLTNREISATMHLAEKTVKNQLTGIFRRLGVRNRTEAAMWARSHLAL